MASHLTWPVAVVIVALAGSCAYSEGERAKHSDDGQVACAKAGEHYREHIFSKECTP